MKPSLTQRPYLTEDDLKGTNRLLALDWMTYLTTETNHTRTLTTLAYYQNIGWITPDAQDALTEYLSNIDTSHPVTDHINAHETLRENLERFEGTPFETHFVSLQYIAALTGVDLDDLKHEVSQARKWMNERKEAAE